MLTGPYLIDITMKILMIGATGKFAGLVLPQLKKQGHHVTALVRDGERIAQKQN